MAGTKEGAKKGAALKKQLYGEDYFKKLGKLGGDEKRGGFKLYPKLAKQAGKKGGKAKNPNKGFGSRRQVDETAGDNTDNPQVPDSGTDREES